jgi:hypothetical protein
MLLWWNTKVAKKFSKNILQKKEMASPVKVHFASLSIGASVDQQTGTLSVFDVVEEIRLPQTPATMQSLVIALILEKMEMGEFKGKMMIHVFLPDGTQQMIGDGEMQIPGRQKKMKAVFRFGGFPIPQFGHYRFVLSLMGGTGSKVGEALLDFDVIQATQVAQGVTPAEKPPLAH